MNRLDYDNGFWPVNIESKTDADTLNFVAQHLWLVALPPRQKSYDVLKNTNINAQSAQKLSAATTRCWQAIMDRDVQAWGQATRECFEAQLEMYPAMFTPEMAQAIEEYKDLAYGWKVSGCGGGGYLILISDKSIPDTIKVQPVGL